MCVFNIEVITMRQRPKQKLIAFTEKESDINKIKQAMDRGWHIVSLTQGARGYVGILEEKVKDIADGSVYIPNRRKIKITL